MPTSHGFNTRPSPRRGWTSAQERGLGGMISIIKLRWRRSTRTTSGSSRSSTGSMIAAVSRTEPPEMSARMNDMLSRTSRIDTTVAPRRRTRIPILQARRYHRPMTAGCPTRLPDVVDRPHCLDERKGRVKRNRGALDVAVNDAAWGADRSNANSDALRVRSRAHSNRAKSGRNGRSPAAGNRSRRHGKDSPQPSNPPVIAAWSRTYP